MEKEIVNYKKNLSKEDSYELESFFKKFDKCCLIELEDKMKIKNDLVRAIIFYVNNGLSQNKALKLLAIENFGTFYTEKTKQKYELDDIAKIISLPTSYNFMCMFRLSVYLKKEVIPELLQIALIFTIKRFPIFATKFKRNFFWHVLEIQRKRYYIEKESGIPCQPINVRKNTQLFRIVYYKNRVSLEMFHVLTDGTGGLAFIKALIAEYLRLTEIGISIDKSIYDINSPVEEEELENACKKILLNKKISENFHKKALRTKGRILKNKPCRIIHFKLDSHKLKTNAKKYNTTVTGYLSSLMFVANKAATRKSFGDTNVVVPVNLRNYYPSKTVRNFSLFCILFVSNDEVNDFPLVVQKVNEQLNYKLRKNYVEQIIIYAKKIVKLLNKVPLFMKQPGSKIIYNYLSNNYYTNTLSNLGVVKFPDSISKHIESMDVFINTAIVNRLVCSVITVNNVTTFSIAKITDDSIFEETLYNLFCKDGLIPIVEGSELYED